MRQMIVFPVLLTVLLVGCTPGDAQKLADGSTIAGDAWDGQWLLVNYWAEWCAPCRKEIPELNRFNAESPDVTVVGVNYDGLQGKVLADLVVKMGIEFPVLVADPRERWGEQLPAVLPSTFVIAPDGTLKDVLIGPQSFESLARAVQVSDEAG
ncbi:MAG: TlpA disulfide reductase family protein [Pseudomonadales bacterium]|nr:TlpA family protein disulfide reductase [Pseudomonadales bacterium]